ncbi:alanine racemase [Vibrio coralliilyticus]|uniref:alanine/ornithine racemase family PLP-dependent enzyme n=1 Tax=Vibrio coralliilyticus TaxID=190893 RepID=UPI000810B8F6|nr:alanine/ornithine racemase family PLP-dependent enzyme [Vibrio coralliilyticus]ANW26954.1 alanine racemase [Vibrio coralliilyticus]
MKYPRLDIDCGKIHHNTQFLITQLSKKNISVTPVTKVFLGNPIIAQVLLDAGATVLADSRIENLKEMTRAGIPATKMLIRTPMLSQIASVIKHCDISLNSEVEVVKKLSNVAKQQNRHHEIIIMIELGDLREGVMPDRVIDFVREIISLPNITIKGVGANLACRYGVAPDRQNMTTLSDLADGIEAAFGINLEIVSGGNSASVNWALQHTGQIRVNNLRLGEALFLGCEPLDNRNIKGLYTDTVSLTAEVIESKIKPSLPWGKRGFNTLGKKEHIQDRGNVSQVILALGRQDVCITGLRAPKGVKIISSTSDHLLLETSNKPLFLGEKVTFNLDYNALLSSMSSHYIYKYFNKSKSP